MHLSSKQDLNLLNFEILISLSGNVHILTLSLFYSGKDRDLIASKKIFDPLN